MEDGMMIGSSQTSTRWKSTRFACARLEESNATTQWAGQTFFLVLPVKAYLALAAKVRPIISRSELNGCLVPCEATSWSWLCLSRPSFDFVLDWRESWSSIRSSGSACVPWLVLGPYHLSRWPIGMRSDRIHPGRPGTAPPLHMCVSSRCTGTFFVAIVLSDTERVTIEGSRMSIHS
jgi:hypothetical protein